MTALLIKLFVKDSKNVGSERVRRAYGNLSGATGIFLNVLLAAAKIAAGAVSGAISVLADGLNNLSDCGSSAVSLVGFRMAGKPADKKHPFGHQRAEYLAALIVAMIVLVLAVELLVESVSRIITPTGEDVWSVLNVTVLSVSIGVKLWLFVFNRIIAKRIDSEAVRAASLDSLTDCLATSAVLIAVIVARYTDVNLDGYMGIVVALFIGFAGAGIFKETLGKLLGEAPDPDIIKKIRERIFTHEGVHGIHDLMVHSYGHSKYYASVHVEVDANMPMMEGHDLADRIEREARDYARSFDDDEEEDEPRPVPEFDIYREYDVADDDPEDDVTSDDYWTDEPEEEDFTVPVPSSPIFDSVMGIAYELSYDPVHDFLHALEEFAMTMPQPAVTPAEASVSKLSKLRFKGVKA